MLTYLTVEIMNNPYVGSIQLTSTSSAVSTGSITQIKINRKEYGKSWELAKTINVSSTSDFVFNFIDLITKSNTQYSYYIDLVNGNNIVESQTYDFVECWFEGLVVANTNKMYVAGTNVTIKETVSSQVAYVNTLTSRTPYRVANTSLNYSVVNASGLFLKLTGDMKKFIPDDNHGYSKEVAKWLLNGEDKIVKDGEGRVWYASIDGAITLENNDHYKGYNMVSFSFTEIGDIPEFEFMLEVQ